MKKQHNQGFIFNGKRIKTGLTSGDRLRIIFGCLILSAFILSGLILFVELIAYIIW